MLWIPICIAAGFIQTIRNALQKNLKAHLPTEMVTWVRFIYGLPIAILYIFLLHYGGSPLPTSNVVFWNYCIIASISQIMGNILLVALFSHRNFVIGVTYSKTEAILSAIIAASLFAEFISVGGFFAIIIGMIGITLISVVEQHTNPRRLLKGIVNKPALIGIASGLCYASAGVFIRQASISLEGGTVLTSSAYTLVFMLGIQTFLLGLWVIYKYRNFMELLIQNLRNSIFIGFTNTLASIGWFTAFTMTQTAYVMAVSQVEVIFSLILTQKLFKESVNRMEMAGMALVVVSILLLLYV